jgi:hypothetical protein
MFVERGDLRGGPNFEGAEMEFLGRVRSDGRLTSVNDASGNCRQTARSSAVMVSQPYRNMYRPGSVTRPAFCHVTLLTTDSPSVPGFSKTISR